ncbi:thiamine diphosphokinase [Bacillus sp. RG28]|uniref:Thiamine diphosphokinase n=1 Tax=Gottfriedia endophytica TaxID=2820819 RepID=A0A940SJG0_9BACI|nr:thiamine diphosphokinase [Gottfriedia endophytica]MBP0724864.1 thiamine diphosphokinase [Gottfriedia endophytica]
MIIHLVGAGPRNKTPFRSIQKNENEVWIGVDRGAGYLLSEGIIPEAIFGDFDSISQSHLEELKEKIENVFTFPPEKDDTDLELALKWALDQGPNKIMIHCVTGGRLDHEFGSINTLVKYLNHHTDILILDDVNEIKVLKEGSHLFKKSNEYKYISFFSLGNEVKNLTLEGFKYPLTNYSLKVGSSLCVSNEILNESGAISFASGIVLVIRSKD